MYVCRVSPFKSLVILDVTYFGLAGIARYALHCFQIILQDIIPRVIPYHVSQYREYLFLKDPSQ